MDFEKCSDDPFTLGYIQLILNEIVEQVSKDTMEQQKKEFDLLKLKTKPAVQKRTKLRHIISDESLSSGAQSAQELERQRLARLEPQKRSLADDDVIDLSSDEEDTPSTSTQKHPRLEPKTETEPQPFRDSDTYYDDLSAVCAPGGRLIINAGHGEDEPDVVLSQKLAPVLKAHQIGGVRFMYDNIVERVSGFDSRPGFGCILAHSMGLGKTLQVISFVDIFIRYTSAKRVLTLVPINTLHNWLYEYNYWLPTWCYASAQAVRKFNVYVINDSCKTAEQRATVIQEWHTKGGVLLMGYEMFRTFQTKLKLRRKRKTKATEGVAEVIDIEQEEVLESLRSKVLEWLADPGPDLIICDEGHRIKNLNTETAKTLCKIKTRRRIILTGYPLQNNLLEYYCMVNFVRPNYLGTKTEFSNMFARPIRNGQCIDSNSQDMLLARQRTFILIKRLKGFVQRKTHALLRDVLPPCTEYVLYLRKSPIQHRLYRRFLLYIQGELANVENAAVNPLKTFAVCCKIWNHPDILFNALSGETAAGTEELDVEVGDTTVDKKQIVQPAAFVFEPGKAVKEEEVLPKTISYEWARESLEGYERGIIENSYKMTIAFDIIYRAVTNGEKVLLYSQSLFTLELIERILSASPPMHIRGISSCWKRNHNYFRLDGSTTAGERERLIKRFNNEPAIHLFLISTRAGSLGINLTAANRVIIFDASWNPCHDAQAVCRVYRYGQTKKTYIYRLICDNSMEKAIFTRQIGKQGLSRRVVDDKQVDPYVTRDELQNLMQYDESADVLLTPIDFSNWETSDAVLKDVCLLRNTMLAQRPVLQDSFITESDDKMSEEEQREAQESYEQAKQSYKTKDWVWGEMMHKKNQSEILRSYWDNVVRSGPSLHPKPMGVVRPLQSTPNPMHLQAVARHHNYYQNYPHPPPSYPMPPNPTPYPLPQAQPPQNQINPPVHSRADASSRIIVTGTDAHLSSLTYPGQITYVPEGTQVHVVRTPDGIFVKTADGNVMHAKNSPYAVQAGFFPFFGQEQHYEQGTVAQMPQPMSAESGDVIDLCDSD